MKLRVESSDEDIIIVKKDELIDIESEIILNSILKQIYPDKYIKRIIYKPYLDYFFPYLDLSLDGRSNQLTLFYGDQNVHLSDKKYCISCNKELSTGNLSKIQVPVSLCQRCLELLFHGCQHYMIRLFVRIYFFLDVDLQIWTIKLFLV